MAEGESEVKRPRLSDSAQCAKVALITGITGQVWTNQLFCPCCNSRALLFTLHVGWVISSWTSFRKRIHGKFDERMYATWILLHGTRYTVSSVDQVPLTQDVSYIFMLTAQLTPLEVRTLRYNYNAHSRFFCVVLIYQEWYYTMEILLMLHRWSDWWQRHVVTKGRGWEQSLSFRSNLMKYTILVLKVMSRYFSVCLQRIPPYLLLLVKLSFDLSEYTANVDGVGTLRLLDAVRTAGLEKTVKFYQVKPWVHQYGHF